MLSSDIPGLLVDEEVALPPPGPHTVSGGCRFLLDWDLDGDVLGTVLSLPPLLDQPVTGGVHVTHQVTLLTAGPHGVH